MPESSETPGQRAQRLERREGSLYGVDITAFARDVIALEAVARRLLDGWETCDCAENPDRHWSYERLHVAVAPEPLTPEEARILDLLRETK